MPVDPVILSEDFFSAGHHLDLWASLPESRGAEAVAPRRILVVDDNADSAEMMAALLEIDGHEVATALSGQDALDLAAKCPPQVALVDIGMPGMNGCELARRM